jgi:hypothetical protein
MGVPRSCLTITAAAVSGTCVLSVSGVLDGTTYIQLRDAINKAALDQPRAVIVDISGLVVAGNSAWAVFPGARWLITEGPDVPMALVCDNRQCHNALCRNGIDRYVPAYWTVDAAIAGLLGDSVPRYWRRVRAELPAVTSSTRRCHELIGQWLTAWSEIDYLAAVSSVATALVENALTRADGSLLLRLETDGTTVKVAVKDTTTAAPVSSEATGDPAAELIPLAAACRGWGRAATGSGTTVWAMIGPENLR